MTTDSYVVQPLFFPGGNIGDLAVNGTINDLACSGAQPIGPDGRVHPGGGTGTGGARRASRRPWARPRRTRASASSPATPRSSERGSADQLFVNTAGVGVVPAGVDISPERARPGDHVIVSGNLGEHGVAIMSVREGIDFGTVVDHRQRAAAPAGGGDAGRFAPGAADARVARPDARWAGRLRRRDRARGCGRCRTRRSEDPGARRPSPRPARSWAWIRCRWPTRARWWHSSTPPQ